MTSDQLNLKEHAACKDKGAEMFFVDEGPISNPKIRIAISKAISLCNRCDVQDLCLMTAVNNEEEFGIWGGFTKKERKKLFSEGQKITREEALEHTTWKRNL